MMRENWIFFLLAFAGGVLLPIQVGLNGQLRQAFGSPISATFVSFSVGLASLLLYITATQTPIPTSQQAASTHWTMWLGGLLGAIYLVVVVIAAPKIGAAAMVGSVVAGQMVCAIILDRLGAIGYAMQPVSLIRVIGAGLIIAGVFLVGRK
jgi:transporter family-2 protein